MYFLETQTLIHFVGKPVFPQDKSQVYQYSSFLPKLSTRSTFIQRFSLCLSVFSNIHTFTLTDTSGPVWVQYLAQGYLRGNAHPFHLPPELQLPPFCSRCHIQMNTVLQHSLILVLLHCFMPDRSWKKYSVGAMSKSGTRSQKNFRGK